MTRPPPPWRGSPPGPRWRWSPRSPPTRPRPWYSASWPGWTSTGWRPSWTSARARSGCSPTVGCAGSPNGSAPTSASGGWCNAMDADDASFVDMRRSLTDPDADRLALDEEAVERLLSGDLPSSQVPPGYAQVAALLAATTAEPTPEELAGRPEVLAELRAVTRPRRAGAHARRAARPPKRRWAGLAAVALVGALLTGGVAVAATGNLPAPVRDVARSILGGAGGDLGPATPTRADPRVTPAASSPASAGVTAGPKGPLPTGSTAPGSGPNLAGPVAR